MEDTSMKKGMAISITIIISIGLLTSCALKSLTDKDATTTVLTGDSSTSSTETSPSTTEATDTSTELSSLPEMAPETTLEETETTHDESLWILLDKITNFPSGSAGSSLKQAAISGELLDWTEDTAKTQDEIETEILEYLASLDDNDQRDAFFANYTGEGFRGTISNLIAGNASTIGLVESAGYIMGHASYTQAKWDAFDNALCLANDQYLEAYTGP
jgi:hypothetical protein